MVRGATIMSALSETTSPISPDHSFLPVTRSMNQEGFLEESYLKSCVFRSFQTVRQATRRECRWSWSSSTVLLGGPCRIPCSSIDQFLRETSVIRWRWRLKLIPSCVELKWGQIISSGRQPSWSSGILRVYTKGFSSMVRTFKWVGIMNPSGFELRLPGHITFFS